VFITPIMEAAITSVKSVNFYQATRRNTREGLQEMGVLNRAPGFVRVVKSTVGRSMWLGWERQEINTIFWWGSLLGNIGCSRME
jgi:hypothetical protein